MSLGANSHTKHCIRNTGEGSIRNKNRALPFPLGNLYNTSFLANEKLKQKNQKLPKNKRHIAKVLLPTRSYK